MPRYSILIEAEGEQSEEFILRAARCWATQKSKSEPKSPEEALKLLIVDSINAYGLGFRNVVVEVFHQATTKISTDNGRFDVV